MTHSNFPCLKAKSGYGQLSQLTSHCSLLSEGLTAVECLAIDNLGGVRLDAQNLAQCTALSAFTMVTHYVVAASDVWIGLDRLNSCMQP